MGQIVMPRQHVWSEGPDAVVRCRCAHARHIAISRPSSKIYATCLIDLRLLFDLSHRLGESDHSVRNAMVPSASRQQAARHDASPRRQGLLRQAHCQPLNGRHRRPSLSTGNPDVLVVLAGVRLGDLAPAPVEQDDDGLYACFGWRIGRNESPHEFPRSQGWGQAFRPVIVQPPPSSTRAVLLALCDR